MRRLVILLILLAMLAAPAAATAPDSAILDEDFEDGVDVFNSSAWGMLELETGHEGAGLRTVIPAGEHWGGSGHWYFEDHDLAEPEELYFRYYVRFPEGFYIEPFNRGKLPGFGGLYTYNCLGNRPSTPEEPCFSARMLFSRTYPSCGQPGYPEGPDDKTLIGYYVYHLDSPETRGDIWTWDPDVATLDHGPWYCVEGHIDLNTPGVHDGVLEGWVDGVPAFDRSDIAFRRADEGWIKIKSFWFDVYYGGDPSLVTNEIQFDSLAFGPERIGCDDAAVYNPPFRDDDDSVFEEDIIWLSDTGITRGCNPPVNDEYCPDQPVTRGQMAAFLARALDLSTPADSDRFVDDDDSEFEADIEALADADITRGCNPPVNDRYCPDRPVTRGQMAAFLTRALNLNPPPDSDRFSDDDESEFEADIEALSKAEITLGCNPPVNDQYCPGEAVTRGQMAAFLHRALG